MTEIAEEKIPAEPEPPHNQNSSHSETKDASPQSEVETATEETKDSTDSDPKDTVPVGVHFCTEVRACTLPFQHGFYDKEEEKEVMWYNEEEIEQQMIENHRVVRRATRIVKCAAPEDTRGLESLMSDKEQLRHEKITAVVLNEQRRQRLKEEHDSEKIAKECSKISEKANKEAVMRGKQDEAAAMGGEGTENQTSKKGAPPSQSGLLVKKKSVRARLGKFASSFRVTKSRISKKN